MIRASLLDPRSPHLMPYALQRRGASSGRGLLQAEFGHRGWPSGSSRVQWCIDDGLPRSWLGDVGFEINPTSTTDPHPLAEKADADQNMGQRLPQSIRNG